MSGKQCRIIVVDDHPIVRRGIIQLLQDEDAFDVVGEADDLDGAYRLAHETRPDVALVDITLRNSNGLELVQQLTASLPSIACLIVSMHDENLYAERALQAGARGYVMKQDGDECIVQAIHRVRQGEIYASPAFNQRLLSGLRDGSRDRFLRGMEELSEREREVFDALGSGKTVREIAEILDVNPRTIETYRRRIRSKLGIEHSAQLAYRAVEWTMKRG